jgi:hypothetical protein
MPNLVITTSCNRACGYCFTDLRTPPMSMAVHDAAEVLDMFRASGLQQVRLLGGEPTLHPEFAAILEQALKRDFEVLVFSNGLMPPEALDAISRSPEHGCRVMLNLPIGLDRRRDEDTSLGIVAERLGPRASVGVNIHSPGMPLDDASEFVKRHGLARTIRVGLAHPRLNRANHYLHPRHYRRVGQELEEWFDAIEAEGFRLSFDCGFVPCMFSGQFVEQAGAEPVELGVCCGPIPDVLPDLSSVHCFPLAELDQLPISGIGTIQILGKMHQERVQPFRGPGVFRECSACELRRQSRCHGGCISAAMLRSRSPAGSDRAAAAAPKVYSASRAPKTWAIPFVNLPVDFWRSLVADYGCAIREVYFPIDLAGVGSGRPPQPQQHLRSLLEARIVPMSVLVNPMVLPQPLEVIGPRISDELLKLYEMHGVASATLSDVRLAELVRRRVPAMRLAASCLLEITEPGQARALRGLFDVLVPATRVVRLPDRIAALREAFGGPVRLLVNEGCLTGCLDRKQHFYEMALGGGSLRSLCNERLNREPWLRLTGAWILPQHLAQYDRMADEYKLAGRATLGQAEHYRKVLKAYVRRTALWPHEIGGGPASVLKRWSVPAAHFQQLLRCNHVCGDCTICRRIAESQWQEEEGR